MPRFLLHHRHEPDECGVAYVSFRAQPSPLRGRLTLASCLSGGHQMWWVVEAGSAAEALAQLPHFVAGRTTANLITEVLIP